MRKIILDTAMQLYRRDRCVIFDLRLFFHPFHVSVIWRGGETADFAYVFLRL